MNKATAHCTVFLARMTLGRKPLEVRQSGVWLLLLLFPQRASQRSFLSLGELLGGSP